MSGNYVESSSYVNSIQKSMAQPADAHVLEHREHYTFNASQRLFQLKTLKKIKLITLNLQYLLPLKRIQVTIKMHGYMII